MRRDHAKTPPKPDSDIVAKAMNNSAMVGGGEAGEGRGSAEESSVERGPGEEIIHEIRLAPVRPNGQTLCRKRAMRSVGWLPAAGKPEAVGKIAPRDAG